MSDGLVHAELLAACSSLGYSDGVQYHREADCLETIRDLLRYLRKDDESHEIRRALGEAHVLQTDLLPLLQDHSDDAELFGFLVRLLVDLTNPTLLLFREELPEEKVTRQQFMQLVAQQQDYKEAFTEVKVWEVLVQSIKKLLKKPFEERDEDDQLLLERLLILTRNVLSVPANQEDEQRTDDDASIHDQVLWALHHAGMEDLLLYLAATHNEQDLSLHVLEIISLMLREQDAIQLAQAGLHRSQKEKDEDGRRLEELRHKEALQRRQQQQKRMGTRHSRFGGTYVVQNVKSLSENDLIIHRPIADVAGLTFDRNKRPKKHRKNLLPMKDTQTTRRSTLAVRLFLQEFCVEFLAGAYNTLMAAVRDSLDRSRAQDHDETYYLWATRLFMEFSRHYDFKVERVTETLNVQMFHFIQTHIENYYEMMTTDKKKIPLWSRRMHVALRAYHELLATLARMDTSPTYSIRESAQVLKSRVFYVVEYRELMLLLLQNYDPRKMSMGYLRDAVEATHIFLKLLEGFCGRGRHIMVQQKVKKHPKNKPKTEGSVGGALSEAELQDLWDEISPEVAALLQGEGGDLPTTIPFDTLSEDTEEQQKEAAMRRVSKHLREKQVPDAISLLRAAREVWPEGDIFGASNMDNTEEFLTMQEIFMANLNPPQQTPVDEEEEKELDEEEQEEERIPVMSEQEFDFTGFVRRFANTKVVKVYSRLLEHYPTNTAHTNHCILKLFHRLAWNCKLPVIFFQVSLFRIFLQAMDDPLRERSETPKEIARFGKYIMRQLYKVAETNPKVFVEMLFWKTNKEALEIELGYGVKESSKQAWKEEEEEELRRLHEEVESIPIEERGDKDVVDLVMDRLISQTRTRRSIIKKLKELGLIRDISELKRKTARFSAPRQWTEEEEAELRALFQENRESMDIVGRIMDSLNIRRPKHRVVEKILELGLVADRKDLRKKRPKKTSANVSQRKRRTGQDFLEANRESDDGGSGRDGESSAEDTSNEGSESDEEAPTECRAVSRKPSQPPVPVATPALISKALSVVLEAGQSEAVEWLARVLTDVADDREEDGDFEPIPILAITEACTTAMENEDFLKLLRLVGLQAPLSHQEMFWRVPSRLSVDGLRKRAQYLTQGVSGDFQAMENPDEPLEPVEETQIGMETQKRKQKKKKKKKKEQNTTPRSSTRSKDSTTLDSEEKENYPLEPSSSRLRDDSSNDEAPLSSLMADSVLSPSFPISKVKKRVNSDDSDSMPAKRGGKGGAEDKRKKLVMEEETGEQKKHSLLDSEDEEGEGPRVNSSRKKRLVLDSDSEGETEKNEKKKSLVLDSDSEEERKEEKIGEMEKGKKRNLVLDSDSETELEEKEEASQVKRKKVRPIIDSDDDD